MDFLDTTIYKNREQNKLSITVYCKVTDLKNFLQYKSAHPKSLRESIPYGQPLRLKELCTETLELTQHLKELKQACIKRSYQDQFLDRQFG